MDTIDARRPYDVLCFGAHPDDVEMGMAGTVAALTAMGKRVAVVDLTHGEIGTHGSAEMREKEARAASRILGSDRRILDHPDGGVQDTLKARHEVAGILRECRPEIVFAPYPDARTGPYDGRSNEDHLATGAIVRAAAKLARFRKLDLMPPREPHTIRRLYSYMLPDFLKPSLVVDVSPHCETLEAAIRAFASQMPIARGNHDILDLLLLHRRASGLLIGVDFGESFLSEDPLGGLAETLFRI
jgi:bacillithiol biosynthesis deacetylase BshB1